MGRITQYIYVCMFIKWSIYWWHFICICGVGFLRGQCTVLEIILADSVNHSDTQYECKRILHWCNPAAHVVMHFMMKLLQKSVCKPHSLTEDLSKPVYLYTRLAVPMKSQPDRKRCKSGMLSVWVPRFLLALGPSLTLAGHYKDTVRKHSQDFINDGEHAIVIWKCSYTDDNVACDNL